MIHKLKGLNGLTPRNEDGTFDALFIERGSDLLVVFNNGFVATSAGNNGAMNIWKDDEDKYHCEAMRFLSTIDFQIFEEIEQAINWVDNWISKIH